MPYSTLDTERIEWRDPTFFEEERMVRRALPKIHVLASDLWVLSKRFHQRMIALTNIWMLGPLGSAFMHFLSWWKQNAPMYVGPIKTVCVIC